MPNDTTFDNLKARLKQQSDEFNNKLSTSDNQNEGWHKVSVLQEPTTSVTNRTPDSQFVGKNFENGQYAGEDLHGTNFSVANLSNIDFSNANLAGCDFSGANLTGANFAGADLTGAILSGAVLRQANFSKAKLNGIKLIDADLEDAILLDIDIDSIGIEELQSLVEYMAKYCPHKLNLRKLNLKLLNLATIDLSQLDLRGVDFTGVNFTGVSLVGLDLSECVITIEQIAQALGHPPSKEELAKILAPKKKKNPKFNALDLTELFLGNGKTFGIIDVQKDKGISIETLVKVGKKILGANSKSSNKDDKSVKEAPSEEDKKTKSHNEELRQIIEERKAKELAERKAQKEHSSPENTNHPRPQKIIIPTRDTGRGR